MTKRLILPALLLCALLLSLAQFSKETPVTPGEAPSDETHPVVREKATQPDPLDDSALTFPSEQELILNQKKQAEAKFDPRFVQPATKARLFGIMEEEDEETLARKEAEEARRLAEVREWARIHNKPIEGKLADGSSYELMRIENGEPIYYKTNNAEARISHNVHKLNQFDGATEYNLSGNGWTVGMWEDKAPRLSHNDFAYFNDLTNRRVTYLDQDEDGVITGNVFSDHATHVLGTLIGNGSVDPDARGMAWLAEAKTFDWKKDTTELETHGASAPNQPGKLYVTNHSYGYIAGWYRPDDGDVGFLGISQDWTWGGRDGETEDYKFGLYDNIASAMDLACYRRPYLLPFNSAGNDRGESPRLFASVEWNGNTGTEGITGGIPDQDGGDLGYDTIPGWSISKNFMTVGNLGDAVADGERSTSGVELSSSSGFGPADDGRIKPDIVANGTEVLSAVKSSDTALGTKSGTSMASPGAAGTAILLHEHYTNSTGQYMRASTTKALIIHTATDLFLPGPDYKSGWGLIDGLEAARHIDRHVSNPGGFHILEDSLTNERKSLVLTFEATSAVKATLVWTDPAADGLNTLDDRNPRLVNDLDLTIIDPNGDFYFAPVCNPLQPSEAATYTSNNIDNVEKLGGSTAQTIPAIPGTYQLIISYSGSLTDPNSNTDPVQAFSLMLEGNDPATTGTLNQALDNDAVVFDNNLPGITGGFAYQVENSANDSDRAVNVPLSDNQTAAFELTVTGPKTISFDWGVSSEASFDFLRFSDNGTVIEEISGQVANTPVGYAIPAGIHTLRWAYEKDGSESRNDDQGWVDKISFNNFAEGIDNFDHVWIDSPNSTVPWGSQEITNVASVPTGDIGRSGTVNSSSDISAITTDIEGPALVQFTMVQNAESGSLYAAWDLANPGFLVSHRTGNVYQRYSVILGPGTHDFHFVWTKPDATPGSGFVDEFVVTPLPEGGSLSEAADVDPTLNNSIFVFDQTQAAWVPDDSNGAPVGPDQQSDSSAIRTEFIPTDRFPNTTNDSSVTYSVSGPALLSFWWQCTGAPDGNLRLEVDPVGAPIEFSDASPATSGPRMIEPIPGGTEWQQVHLEVPPGIFTYRWRYTAGPSNDEGAAWIDQVKVTPGALHPSRGLDHWTHKVESYGNAFWHAVPDDTNEGIDSTTHEDLADDESTTLTTTVTGPKKLFFQWKVSSEFDFDFLTFTLDGEKVVKPISGEVDWTPVSVDIPAGNHVLRWTYSKDGTVSRGSDQGWIDGISLLRPDFGITFTPISATNAVINLRKGPTGGYFLEESSDLITWSALSFNGLTDARQMLSPAQEDAAVIVDIRPRKTFYRLRFQPEYRHQIENSSFENPVIQFGTASNGPAPGWTTSGSDSGVFINRLTIQPTNGEQFLGIENPTILTLTNKALAFRGIHSASISVANREGLTSPQDLSTIVLRDSTVEVGSLTLNASTLDSGTFADLPPVTYDDFQGSSTVLSALDVQLRSDGGRYSFFDHLRIVTEYE